MTHEPSQFRLPSLREVCVRHRKKIVLVPTICLLAGALFFIFCPRTYRSEARLFLRVGRESIGMDPAATTGQTLPFITADRKDEVQSAQEIFKSRAVAAAVVDRLGPEVVLGSGADAPQGNTLASILRKPVDMLVGMVKSLDPISEREEAMIELERNLSVSGDRQSTVITIEYAADSPQLAQQICTAVVEVGQQEHVRVHRSDESRPFFTEQQERLRGQLDQSLEALRTAKDEMGLADITQRRTTLEQQYKAIELDRLSSQQQLATAQARVKDLERQLAEVPERLIAAKRTVPNQGADLLRDRLYELELKLMDLKARYNNSHPLVQATADQLNQAQKVLNEQDDQRAETSDEINPVHRELSLAMKQERSVVAGLESRLTELEEQKATVLADLRAVNSHDLKIDQLTREADLARDKFMQYARTLEEARIDKELQAEGLSNISLMQTATLAEKPVAPSRGMTVAGTFLLAIAGTVGLVLVSERQNPPVLPPAKATTVMKRYVPRRRPRRELASQTPTHV